MLQSGSAPILFSFHFNLFGHVILCHMVSHLTSLHDHLLLFRTTHCSQPLSASLGDDYCSTFHCPPFPLFLSYCLNLHCSEDPLFASYGRLVR